MGSRGVQLMKLTISGSTNGPVPWIWRRFLSVALSPLLSILRASDGGDCQSGGTQCSGW